MEEQDDDLLGLNAQREQEAVEQNEPVMDAADDAGDADEGEEIPEGYVPPGVVAKIRGGYKTQLSKKDAELKALQEQLKKFEQPQQRSDEPQQPLTPEQQMRDWQLNMEERQFRREYGDEVIDEAQKWFSSIQRSDPYRAQAIMAAQFPYEALVKSFHDQLLLEELQELQAENGFDPADPDGWALQRAQMLAQQQRQQPQQQSSQQAPPPRSLASMPSSGGGAGTIRTGPGAAFDDLF